MYSDRPIKEEPVDDEDKEEKQDLGEDNEAQENQKDTEEEEEFEGFEDKDCAMKQKEEEEEEDMNEDSREGDSAQENTSTKDPNLVRNVIFLSFRLYSVSVQYLLVVSIVYG